MTWTRATMYVVLAAVLVVLYAVTAPPPPVPRAPNPTPARPALAITALRLESAGKAMRVERDGERWRVVEPVGVELSSDLIAALITAVLETPAEPVSTDPDRLAEFGLDTPRSRITFTRQGADPVVLSVGSRNPAETGVYGQLAGNPQVVLMGLNVEYYVGLVMRNVGTPTSGAD